MKKYPFKYNPAVFVMLILATILSVAGLITNVFNVVEYFKLALILKVVLHILFAVISAFIAVFSLSVMIKGYYKIDGKKGYLYCRFGIVLTKEKLSDVQKITVFSKSGKLLVYFKDAKYTTVVIDKNLYDDFIGEMLKENPEILYEKTTEETP